MRKHATGELVELGYSPRSFEAQLRLLRYLSGWLTVEGLAAGDLTAEVVGRFLAERRRVGAKMRSERALAGPIAIGTMFRSPGLGNKIVAFLGNHDRLIVKLPRDRAAALVNDGTAETVTMGSRTMREWVAIPANPMPEKTRDTWTDLTGEAMRYVRE